MKLKQGNLFSGTWLLVVLTIFTVSPVFAVSFTVVQDDEPTFNSLLSVNPSSSAVDTGSSFAVEPTLGNYGAGNPGFTRSGLVDGSTFGYGVSHFDYSNSPTGTLAGDTGTERSFRIENPVSQDGASFSSWGFDESSGSTSTRNALLVDFTTTPGNAGIGHFGINLLDV